MKMLLTFTFMIYTAIRARWTSKYKTAIHAAFKEYQNQYSIMFYPTFCKCGSRECAEKLDKDALTSHLCYNKHLAHLHMMSPFDATMGMYIIHPQQKIDISNWLNYKDGKSLFPLFKVDDCQISRKSDLVHVLIETDLQTYSMDISECCIKLEDYGLIKAWSVNENLNLLLETNIDHITDFITMFIQGRYFINNNLYIKRIQTVVASGKPCVYEDSIKLFSPPRITEAVIALSKAAQEASEQNKPIEVTKFPDVIVRPQKNLDDREEESKFEDPSKETPVVSEIEEKINDILSFTINPVNRNKSDANGALPVEEKTSEGAFKSSQEEEEDVIVKPPNVLIYTDKIETGKSVKAVLSKVLDPDRYTIYNLTILNLPKNTWVDQVALVVVCGNIMDVIADRFVEYIIHGGKVLSLCSNMLHKMLPFFKTAEVRENELVYFSYGEWKRVRMMHDTFCYQASPKRNGFVENHEDARLPSLNLPESTSVKDKKGNSHMFDVKILGTEETWQNPSILLATLASSGGKVVFSQIHLERDPMEYSRSRNIYETLKENDAARLGIISDLLSTYLEMEITRAPAFKGYSIGYLLSRKEDLKWEMLKNIDGLTEDYTLNMGALTIRFYTDEEIHVTVTDVFLPIVTHHKFRPKNFSPEQYYQFLDTRELGQLIIYTDVLKSSMYALSVRMKHGLAVIPRQQTQGQGRGNHVWLSPIGCAMFTLQVYISRDSILSKQISLLQHIVAVAMVSAVRSIPEYQAINLRIKWPNDIYVGKSTKIGGLIVRTLVDSSHYICDIGAGINLSNSKPTTCINDVISQYNQKHQTKLEKFSLEKYLALVFNQLEILLDDIEKGNIQRFYDLYYKYWLHKNASVTILTLNGEYQEATVDDIDDFGYLRVNTSIMGVSTKIAVHPDRNSFDFLQGLIIPVIEEDI